MIFGPWARHTSILIKLQAGELLGATLSLFYLSRGKNSRLEGGAFIRSLQTGCLGKIVEKQIEADCNRVEEGIGRKCNRFSSYGHLYPMRPVGLQALRERRRCWLGNSAETQTIKPLTVATALFDPQQSRPC